MDDTIWMTGLFILGLLFLSGLFSGSETALTAASKARLHRLATDGDKRAERVLALIEDKERLIGAILLGNNLVNILATSLATSLFLSLVGEEGIFYATLVMTALVLVFAEVMPKTYAIARTERMALFVSPIIRLIVVMLAPVVGVVQHLVRFTLGVFGVDIRENDQVLSVHEELRGAIDLHSAEGALKRTDREMLGGVLDLNEVLVEDVMIHRSSMQALNVDLSADDIITAVVRSPYTRLPIYEGEVDNIIGILHAKDVLRAMRRAGGQLRRFNLRRIMVKPWFVPETTTLQEQLNAFKDRKSHFALVVDEYGDLQGMVTLEDILEEIVGDIADEHDFDVPGAQIQNDGSVEVEGTVTIRDLNRLCHFDLPDEQATTVAGLVLYEAETIPIVGQSFRFHGYRFDVTARKRNQITGLKIRKL